MINYMNSIDTDTGIGSILSNFDTAYIVNAIRDSLNMRFRPYAQAMPNYIDILNRQFNSIIQAGPDYKDKIEETRTATYIEIIKTICEFYNLEFTMPFEEIQPLNLYGITRTLYDIFVSRFTFFMIKFFTEYIEDNYDSIYAYLVNDENVKRIKEKDTLPNYHDPKFQLIHANLNRVILNMAAYDISLDDLLHTFLDDTTATGLSNVLEDKGDIYKYFYASYLSDDNYMADLLTCIKLTLQSKTQEAYKFL